MVSDNKLVRELHELIAALDRRVPRLERAAESSIAGDAAALKAKALKRLEELQDTARRTESGRVRKKTAR